MFPRVWLDLLRTHSSLGETAVEVIASVEEKVAEREQAGAVVYPLPHNRYRALEMVTPDQCAASVVGQDPYHNVVKLPDGSITPEAMGLSFSVPEGSRIPPSLRNIFKEMASDTGCDIPVSGDLTHLAEQGVLMLNSVLSVEAGKANSHAKLGWQVITSAIVEALSNYKPGIVFILWGESAKLQKANIADNQHCIIESSHPSPIGGSCYKSFFGSRPFSRTNKFLIANGRLPIAWAPTAKGNLCQTTLF